MSVTSKPSMHDAALGGGRVRPPIPSQGLRDSLFAAISGMWPNRWLAVALAAVVIASAAAGGADPADDEAEGDDSGPVPWMMRWDLGSVLLV